MVKEIAYEAFYNCQNRANITRIIIPNTIEKIGYSAFYNCTSLESIVIPESVTAIAYYAFYNCYSLESITFEDTANWYVTSTESYWQYKINGSTINVSTPSSNAYNFTTSYGYYWYKN